MNRRTFIVGIGAVLAGCTGSGEPEPTPTPTPELHQQGHGKFSTNPNLVIVETDGVSGQGVTGIVENRTGDVLDYVEVMVFFRHDDVRVGDGIDVTRGLRRSEEWQFSIPFHDEFDQFMTVVSDSPI